MSTKFADFLTEKKIDGRRLIAASAKIERLRPEDRALKLAKRLAKGDSGDKSKKAPTDKPRTGRPVTERALAAATTGKSVSGPQKTRILRAVNAILEQKKQPAVELSALF
jgi:hypothetical protein